jgi:hypothetical protein
MDSHMQRPELLMLREVIQRERESACLLDPDGAIVGVNGAWDAFATANAGAPACLGTSVIGTLWLDAIHAGDERRFFSGVLAEVLAGTPRTVEGECNTPDVARTIVSRFEPVRADVGGTAGVVALYGVLSEAPIGSRYPLTRPDPAHLDAHGIVHQCGCCRRVRRQDGSARWEFVREYVAAPRAPAAPPVSHGVCPTCARVRYGFPEDLS